MLSMVIGQCLMFQDRRINERAGRGMITSTRTAQQRGKALYNAVLLLLQHPVRRREMVSATVGFAIMRAARWLRFREMLL